MSEFQKYSELRKLSPWEDTAAADAEHVPLLALVWSVPTVLTCNSHGSIILVAGLGGHYVSTWEAIDGTVWPRDFLPNHGSAMNNPLKLRIKSFHYNTTIKGTTSIAGLREHAADLIRKLYNDREDDMAASIRPLIFIGHSLGGMLIKRVSRSIPTYPIFSTQVLLLTNILRHCD